MNKNPDMYSDELLDEIKMILKDYNLFYGYTTIGKSKDDQTSFFAYKDGVYTANQKLQREGYKGFNLATLSQIGKEKAVQPLHYFNTEEKSIAEQSINPYQPLENQEYIHPGVVEPLDPEKLTILQTAIIMASPARR